VDCGPQPLPVTEASDAGRKHVGSTWNIRFPNRRGRKLPVRFWPFRTLRLTGSNVRIGSEANDRTLVVNASQDRHNRRQD
jgi:hypothetical protein